MPQQQSAAAPASAPAASAPGFPALTPEYLASILAGVSQQSASQQLPSLAHVLSPQNVVPLLQSEAVQRRLGELLEHLPPELQGEAATQVWTLPADTGWKSSCPFTCIMQV